MLGEESELGSFPVPLPEHYRNTRPYLMMVRGDSMDLVFIEGTMLVCVDLANLNEDPIEGECYIVWRTRPDGSIESTVKEYRRGADGKEWAWPRSSNPQWQTPYRLDEGEDGDEVELHAKVIFVLGRPIRRP